MFIKATSIWLVAISAVLASLNQVDTALAADVSITVNWNSNVKDISPFAFGINNPSFMDPAATSDTSFMSAVESITQKKPLVRIHGWGMLGTSGGQSWLNPDKTWNATKIANALRPVVAAGYNIVINIPDGPNGTGGGAPDPDLIANPNKVANWVASLVKIVNVDNKFNVKYWEFPNEREAGFATNGLTASQMSTLLRATSRAVKAVDSSVKFGGPATAWINAGYVRDVVSGSPSDIDFVTVHTYPGGGDYSSEPIATRYNSAQNMSEISTLRSSLNSLSPSRYIPIFISEYNISWESSPNNINFNNQGAVFDALLATNAIRAGADASQIWEVSRGGSWHSLVQSNNTRYPMSNYLTLLNRFFIGQMQTATSSNKSSVDVFSAKSISGSTTTFATMLINRTTSTRNVDFNFSNFNASNVSHYVIDSAGYSGPSTITWPISGGLNLPAQSVVVLIATSSTTPNPTPVPPTPTPTPSPNGNAVVNIRNTNSGLCVDVTGASTASGALIQQFWCNTTNAQRFSIRRESDGNYSFTNVGSAKCFDIAGSSTSNGARLQQSNCSYGANQRFKVTNMGSGNYRLAAVHSNKCIEVRNASRSAEAKLQQNSCSGQSSQSFKFTVISGSLPF